MLAQAVEAIDNAITAVSGEAHGWWLRRARSLTLAANLLVNR